jgi:type I restriction enzyme S subunit
MGRFTKIKTGKLDANSSSIDGAYPFFTCSREPLKISNYSYDCECVLVAGNGDLNVKYYSGKFDAYQRTYIIESTDKRKLNTRYLFYFLDKYVEKLREQSIGGVIKYIKLGYLTDAQIPLPLLEVQLQIADVLDRASALIEKRKAQIDKLDILVKSQFIEMFGDPVTNPKGWETKKLGNVINNGPQNGLYKPADSYVTDGIGTPILRIDAFYDGEITDLTTLKRLRTVSAGRS